MGPSLGRMLLLEQVGETCQHTCGDDDGSQPVEISTLPICESTFLAAGGRRGRAFCCRRAKALQACRKNQSGENQPCTVLPKHSTVSPATEGGNT